MTLHSNSSRSMSVRRWTLSTQFGKANPEAFQYTPFDSEQEKDDAATIMRAYAEMAGDKGYTIYSQADENPALLVWKVTDRRTRKTASSAGAA